MDSGYNNLNFHSSDYISSFGSVTGVYVGNIKAVIINDWTLAKTLFAREEFSGRLRY